MRMFQGSFPRINDRFGYEERGKRKLMVLLIILFFNLRTKLVGLNQIQTVCMPFLLFNHNALFGKDFSFTLHLSFSNKLRFFFAACCPEVITIIISIML